MPSPELTVLTLTLNEAGSLKTFFERVQPAVASLVADYELLVIDGGSADGTVDIAKSCGARVVIQSRPGYANGYREGLEIASGRYILTMDSDFAQIVPEFRDLCDVIAAGHDGAIGSRFSHESILINYPFFKIICNRGFHALVNLLLPGRVRDVSNNLKLYRAEILKNLDIEEHHFAANAETGLKPLLSGYDIREVPISWINRTTEMGSSSFRLLKIAPDYFAALLRTIWNTWRGRRGFVTNRDKVGDAKSTKGKGPSLEWSDERPNLSCSKAACLAEKDSR